MELINYYGNSNKIGIYCIRNLVNGKIYIGSTKTSFSIRKNKHLRQLRNNIHGNEHLQNAWNYYGSDKFSFEVLLICTSDECEKFEGNFIKLYSSNKREFGYNIASVSSYRFKYNLSESDNNKKSIRKIEKALSVNGFESNERGLPKPFKVFDLYGNFIEEYVSAKQYAEKNGGSETYLSGILRSRMLKYHNNNIVLYSNDILSSEDIKYVQSRLVKRVVLYDLNDNFLMNFKSANECALYIGCKVAEIRMCCLGRRSRIKQFKTKYVKN